MELDGTKSKKSLAELYESDWQEKQDGSKGKENEPNEQYVKLAT